MRIRLRWSVALLSFFTLMIALGAIPGQADALSARFGDKTLHLIAYVVLSILCYHSWITSKQRRVILTIAVIALLGLIDESIQATLPYRTASVIDWCFDLLAVLIVVLAKSVPMPWLKLKGIYVSQ